MPGNTVKEKQEQISQNHTERIFLCFVMGCESATIGNRDSHVWATCPFLSTFGDLRVSYV